MLEGVNELVLDVFHGDEVVGACKSYSGVGFMTLKCDQVLGDKVRLSGTSTGAGKIKVVDIKIQGSHTVKYKKKTHFFCPAGFSNPYYAGHYCCKKNMERVFKPQGEFCDGSVIGSDSLCCKGGYRAACKSKTAEGCEGER